MGHGDDKPNGTVLRQYGPVGKDRRKGYKEEQCTKFLTLPTVLTLARVAAIPVFIATFYVDSWWGTAATTYIFVAAAITDWLDGYLARKMCQGTAFGAFLDPVADKLMVAATLVLLCSRPPETALFGNVSWLFPVPAIAIIGREITMSAVREWAASQNTQLLQAVAVNNLGKWKTATQMIALTILVANRDSRCSGNFWHRFALSFSWACSMVTHCIYEENMEGSTEIVDVGSMHQVHPPVIHDKLIFLHQTTDDRSSHLVHLRMNEKCSLETWAFCWLDAREVT